MTLVEANSATPLADVDSLLLDHVHAGVCVIRSTRFMYVNRCLAGMLGYDIAHMLSGMAAIDIVHPEDRPIVLEKIRRRDEGEITAPYDIRLVGNKGRLLHARVCGVYITFGGARANVVTMTDISEVKRALHAADWQARMLALTEDLCLGASMEIEAQRDRVVTSPGLWAMLGRPATSVVLSRRALLAFVPSSDRRTILAAWRQAVPGRPFELQHSLRRADGRLCLVHQRGYVETSADGSVQRGIAILQDVTAQRDAERRLHEIASTDALTGLPSRAALVDLVDHQVAIGEAPVTMLVIDLPQVAQLKQGLGFEASDRLAGLVGGRLRAALPEADVLARLSGGEFALVARGDGTSDVGQIVSKRARLIAAALDEIIETLRALDMPVLEGAGEGL